MSYYYITIETNNCGALYLYSLFWLDTNLALLDLVCNIANLDKEEYQLKVKSFIDNIFTITLNKALAKEAVEYSKKTTVIKPELIYNTEWLLGRFKYKAYFIISSY